MCQHEFPHELGQVGNSFNWHRVVDREPETWVEGVSLDLGDACFLGFPDEGGFQLCVSIDNSDYDVEP